MEENNIEKGENPLQQKENLMAGAYFGEVVSSGVRMHLFTATAMTHCDLVYFEDEDYLAAQVRP